MLLDLRREALWPGSAALLLLQRRIPLLLQRQPRCKLALCCLLSAGTQGRRSPKACVIRATSPERAFKTINSRRASLVNVRVCCLPRLDLAFWALLRPS